ncbi:MAG TPA: PilZ domain-containing protein [Anaerolineae bacterium]|jgi:c-di-GMP-binding flagellar brake protein YcgR|nr:PilZ domain-containing protein [Anaerolineae bacterium]
MQVAALDLVKAGQIVYINDPRGGSRPFGVNNVLNHDLIVCQALGKKSAPLCVSASSYLTITVPQENGAYLVKAEIIESDKERCRVVLRPTGETERIQRRQYFRISKPSILVRYQLIGSGAHEDDGMPVEGMAWDLSGNGLGILIRSPKTMYAGSMIKITISLPDKQSIELTGEIVRVVPKSIIKSEYLLGVHFKKIRDVDRSKIIDFIIQQQLARRKAKKKSSGER